jgi:hypothetical protein
MQSLRWNHNALSRLGMYRIHSWQPSYYIQDEGQSDETLRGVGNAYNMSAGSLESLTDSSG